MWPTWPLHLLLRERRNCPRTVPRPEDQLRQTALTSYAPTAAEPENARDNISGSVPPVAKLWFTTTVVACALQGNANAIPTCLDLSEEIAAISRERQWGRKRAARESQTMGRNAHASARIPCYHGRGERHARVCVPDPIALIIQGAQRRRGRRRRGVCP